MDFLQSMDWEQIDRDEALFLVGFSLTVKVCPDSPESWADAWQAMRRVLERMGCRAWHTLTEFTAKKRPHRHGLALFLLWDFDDFGLGVEAVKARIEAEIERAWLRIANDRGWRVNRLAQHVKEANRSAGWAEYMSKHGGRGVVHYQRDKASLPPAWQGKSGRMWSASQEGWPLVEEVRRDLDHPVRVLFIRKARDAERGRAQAALTQAQDDLRRHEARIAAGKVTSQATENQIQKRERSARAWVRSTRAAGQPHKLSDKERAYWSERRGLDYRLPGHRACIYRLRNGFVGGRSSLSREGQDRLLAWAEAEARRRLHNRIERNEIDQGRVLGVHPKPASLPDSRAGLLFTLRRRQAVLHDAR